MKLHLFFMIYLGVFFLVVRFFSSVHLVGKRQGEKLSSCKQIMTMCPNVKSGYFWIGGNSGSTEYEVFCEMETAQGKLCCVCRKITSRVNYL